MISLQICPFKLVVSTPPINNLDCLSGGCGQNDKPNTQDDCRPMWVLWELENSCPSSGQIDPWARYHTHTLTISASLSLSAGCLWDQLTTCTTMSSNPFITHSALTTPFQRITTALSVDLLLPEFHIPKSRSTSLIQGAQLDSVAELVTELLFIILSQANGTQIQFGTTSFYKADIACAYYL